MIELKQVGYRLGLRQILEQISFEVKRGEMFGIIGPNGSGKSTLLKLISGIERSAVGDIRLDGKPVGAYSRKQMARKLAVLQQEGLPSVGFTVREVVEMGRYPYQSWFGNESDDEQALIEEIMDRLDLTPLASRTFDQLSGGERQRAALGKTMAQQPSVVLLDEPTTYLDIGYQLQMMDYVRAWQKETGLTAVAVLHDLNLAALYCDRLLVLNEGKVYGIGSPSKMLQVDVIEAVYGTRPYMVEHPASGVPQMLLCPKSAGEQQPMDAGAGRRDKVTSS